MALWGWAAVSEQQETDPLALHYGAQTNFGGRIENKWIMEEKTLRLEIDVGSLYGACGAGH